MRNNKIKQKTAAVLLLLIALALSSGCLTASGKLIDSNNMELYKSVNEKMVLWKGSAATYLTVSVTGYGQPPSMKVIIDGEDVDLKAGRWRPGNPNYSVSVYSAGNTSYASVSETNIHSNIIPLSEELKEALKKAKTLSVSFSESRTKLYGVNLTRILPQMRDFLK
ncbi:MAG: hypothetical protein LBU85_08950 [Treponema sp.]|jgi:hypothetical protein|nr:hypothetical protein [Treponema sp.]